MLRKKFVILFLTFAAAAPFLVEAFAHSSARAAAQEASPEVDALVKQLKDAGDRGDAKAIGELAALGTRNALEGLFEVYNFMNSIFMKREVVRVLHRFDGTAEAEQPALQKLMDVSTQAREPELREAALEGLGKCAAHGKDFLAMIIKSPAEDGVRERAMEFHVNLGTKDDHAWYRELYKPKIDEKAEKEREKAEREKKKKDRKSRKDKDKDPGDAADAGDDKTPKNVVNLNTIRLLAFGALKGSMEPKELHEACADDYPKLRLAALEELASHSDPKTVGIATEMFEKVAERPENRIHAAKILAKLEGKKVANEFVKRASNPDTPMEVRRGLAAILAEFDDPDVNRKMIDLLEKKARGAERLFQMFTVRAFKDERVDKAFIKLLSDKEKEIAFAAVELLGERKSKEALAAFAKVLEKNEDKQFSKAVIRATAEIRKDDPTWIDELIVMTGNPDPELRNLALGALATSAGKAQIGKLVEALQDSNWSVRLAALEALESLRDKDAISAMVERMPKEEGRMLDEFANVLWRLTGQSWQDNAAGWTEWWAGAKEKFEFISQAELKTVATRSENWRLRQTTRVESKFFGIRIISHRVIFIVDVSGSMDESLLNDYQGQAGLTRMEVARNEIMRCIKGLDPSALFNVITFSSDVDRWVDGSLAAANEKNRAEAEAYCAKLKAFGGTNTYGSLQEAFADADVDTIFLMSDGEPSVGEVIEPSMIREHVKSWNENRGIVINTIQVGGQFDILQWLAEDSGGTFVKFE